MANGKVQDKFTNRGSITVTEDAANQITFQQLQTGISIFDKRALIINRFEVTIRNNIASLIPDNGDAVAVALTSSNRVTSLFSGVAFSDPAVIDSFQFRNQSGQTVAAATAINIEVAPHVHDFSSLPGGGLIVAGAPIFLAVQGVGAAAAAIADCRFGFQIIELAADEYLELVESQRILS